MVVSLANARSTARGRGLFREVDMPPRKRSRVAPVAAACAVCGKPRKMSFEILGCCEPCQEAVVDAEEARGI